MEDARKNETFLTVEEAAKRLGTTRLRVREAVARSLLKARRDNEGHLRIDLPEGGKLTAGDAIELEPEAIVTFLFDDIEELEAGIAARDAQIADLAALVDRQDAALARTDDVLTGLQNDKARLADMLDRAFLHLDAAAERETQLRGVSERTLDALERALQGAEAEATKTKRLQSLLDRAMALAEQGDGLREATDRSLALLESTLSAAEAAKDAQARRDGLLERSLAAAEDAQELARATAQELTAREDALEKSLVLSERAAALAQNQSGGPRKGFLRRLLGI